MKKKKVSSVRSGIRTHAHIRVPERPELCTELSASEVSLESGALDRSAILTAGCKPDVDLAIDSIVLKKDSKSR